MIRAVRPVSISHDYHSISRQILTACVEDGHEGPPGGRQAAELAQRGAAGLRFRHAVLQKLLDALRHGMAYVDPGIEAYETRYRHRVVQQLKRRATSLGYTLVEHDG
ncbi:MAG: hypothetical protein H0T05_00460 [Acidobacteria bacterium]|nr:hypothetical protein [Acidobacteriota bacterium]MBA3884227.1 hypothetical protein [Acidobacteriota bacterium]